ncbi:MAG TPA: aldo/keto reductase, partial [Solirubrobacteraceae bacterium]|nr:aldo/keto reductase [Solirubrobacteraceae bacterium]
GLSNVNRRQLDDALELAPVGAVQVALSLNDQRAVRGGIVERCDELGIALIAHSPLGGPRRSAALPRREPLTEVAERSVAAPAEVALAWLLGLSAIVIAIPGARRPQTAQSAARAAGLDLDGSEREALDRAFASFSRARRPPAPRSDDREVLVVMGIPGAGKTRIAELYVRRGYARLNRDERGGSLREIADALDGALSSGGRRLVLDNTYLTRSARSYVIEAAGRHGIQARCIWLDTPLAQAQINLAARMLDLFGRLPEPGELQKLARTEPGVMAPTSQMRALRELEEPSLDEGFADVETIPFERSPAPGPSRAGVLVAAPVLRQPGWERTLERGEHDERDSPHLVFDWSPDGTTELLDPCVERLTAVVSGPVHAALCPHAGGPPRCWCRPPLPGLALTFARAHQLDLASSVVVGCRPTDRTLAGALGARYVTVPAR